MQYQRAVTPSLEKSNESTTRGKSTNINIQNRNSTRSISIGANLNGNLSMGGSLSGIANGPLQPPMKLSLPPSLTSGMTSNNMDPLISKGGGNSHHGNKGSMNNFSLLQGNNIIPSLTTSRNQQQNRGYIGSVGIVSNIQTSAILSMPNKAVDLSPNNDNNERSIASRYDLVPVSDEIPPDGIIFSRIRNFPDSLVVYRTSEERARNPERLNLDRRQLDVCPVLEQEHRLRLLNYQNNHIKSLQNLENLQNLIFLDMYNNKLTSLEGPLSSIRGLRVLMAGKNRINSISNLSSLRKLDVLDLHSNDIKITDGLEGLNDLRVLNLAGNKITIVQNLASLQALTELNLRRNAIFKVQDLDKIPALQRVFLSHNQVASIMDIACVFDIKMLVELSLDGNPLCDINAGELRNRLIAGIKGLKHLDLKRISDEERFAAESASVGLHSLTDPLLPLMPDMGLGMGMGGASDQTTVVDFLNSLNLASTPGSHLHHHNHQPAYMKASNTFGGDNNSNSKIGHSNVGLAALARSGRILYSAQSFFDLEVISPQEKALTIVGDAWEWVSNKRLLSNVMEVSIYHVKKETIISKIIPNFSWLPALKNLRLVNNGIESLKQLEMLSELFTPGITQLVVKDNAVCTLKNMLKVYFLMRLPDLKMFNEEAVSDEEKSHAVQIMGPLLSINNVLLTSIDGQKNNSRNAAQKRNAILGGSAIMQQQQGGGGGGGGASAGKSATGISAYQSFDEQFASDLFNDLRSKTLTRRKLLGAFEKAFEENVKKFIKESVDSLA